MTYVAGQLIQTSDITALVGSVNNTQAYGSEAACAGKLAAIYGVGYGTYGLGQTPIILPTVSTSTLVQSSDWMNIFYALQSIAYHTGTNLTPYSLPILPTPLLPTTNYLAPGNLVATSDVEFTPPGTTYDWSGAIGAVEALRTSFDPTYMKRDDSASLTSNRPQTRTFNSEIYHKFTVTFPSEDAARYFFNSGSQIRLTAYVDGNNGSGASIAWANYLTTNYSNLGYIGFGATTTQQIGGDSTGVGTTIGYFDLTTSFQDVFTLQFQTNYDIKVRAKTSSGPYVNGSNGAVLYFEFQFNAAGFTVGVDINSQIFNYRPLTAGEYSPAITSYPITVASPYYQTSESLDFVEPPPGPTPPPPVPPPNIWSYTDVLTGRHWNYNVWDKILSYGYPVGSGYHIDYTVKLQTTGVDANQQPLTHLLSANTDIPSLLVPSGIPVPCTVTVIVEASCAIVGCGGVGGIGAPSGICACSPGGNGGNGGPAMQLLGSNTKIFNYGVIGGGGGGGGGGGAECEYIWNASAGGGGGGAGNEVNGGGTNPCGVTAGRYGQAGQPGKIIAGGNAGLPGNFYTAAGGNGGNIGEPGSPGQTIVSFWGDNAPGGAGGQPGKAIIGAEYLDQAGSQLGWIAGAVINNPP